MVLAALSFPMESCNRKGAICPGSGRTSPGDLSPFNSDGTPKKKGGRHGSNGLVQKKDHKRLHKR